ncbi:hypothetical protein CXG81DRAFT_8916 [Caulochytrium protostelioides]|uniref:CHCH domain-containing protein n=1 Tax=Caulochytrium protostelioides TaxID=1555241 RepID=A0A4P9XEH3_9FUNG|nr:hypothetical protein CXG81DRAFT_8916 [Caulochytrium protostelioides]|eukprot:RKP03943.1 hypothetical protein CXG81DRAFT_8916 [Caulochytrium protostelioides]
MPRRRSAPAPAARPAARAAPPQQQHKAAPTAPVPQQAAPPAPMMAPPSGGGGLMANIASTAAGVAIGHTVGHGLTSLFSGGSSAPAPQPEAAVQQPQQAAPSQPWQTPNPCEANQQQFMKCLDTHQNDITACQFYLDMLKQCQTAQAKQW